MDKAPDAFRTISEVADDLDIPQHVLRFWETRFAQIKPMKRSGGRRYYRPDDVDLLKGIRRLLYGEGYTIRGVQRILKEHGIKSVQGLADQTSAVIVRRGRGGDRSQPAGARGGRDARPSMSTTTITRPKQKGIDYRFVDTDEDGICAAVRQGPSRPPGPVGRPRPRAPRTRAAGPGRLPAIAGYRDEGRLRARRNRPAAGPNEAARAPCAGRLIAANGTASERGAARLAH